MRELNLYTYIFYLTNKHFQTFLMRFKENFLTRKILTREIFMRNFNDES